MATYYLPDTYGWRSREDSNCRMRIKVDQTYNSSTNRSSLAIAVQMTYPGSSLSYTMRNTTDTLFSANGTALIQGNGQSAYLNIVFNASSSWVDLSNASSFSITVNHNADGSATVPFFMKCALWYEGSSTARLTFTESAGSTTLYLQNTPVYTVTCSDRVGSSSGTVLGTSTAAYNYGSSVSGASFGSSTAYDAYYTGYHYIGSSDPVTVTGATTVYRYFALNTWTVSYDANGHGAAPSAQTKTYNVALTLREYIANQSGSGTTANYTVTGNANGGTWSGSNGSATKTPQYTYSQTQWNTDQSGTGTQYLSQESYTANASIYLYAIWRTDTSYAYTYVLPTGTPSKQQSVTVSYNSAGGTSQPSATVSRSMSFEGWYTAATGGTKRTTSSQISASETVYAHYGEGTSPYPSVTLPSPTRSGYTFAGWYTSGGTKVGDGGASYTPTASITLVAHWTPRAYSLSFNAGEHCSITVTRNGSTVTPGANAVTQGDVLTINVSTDTGYTVFSINVNGQSIQNGGTYTVNAANVLVSATASARSHQMTISAGEGCSVSVYRDGSLLVSATNESASVYVNYDNELTIVFTALAGYEILTHTVNGVPFVSGGVYTVTGPVSIVCDGQQFGVAHISVSDVFARFSPYIKGGSSMDRYVPFVFTSGEWRRV